MMRRITRQHRAFSLYGKNLVAAWHGCCNRGERGDGGSARVLSIRACAECRIRTRARAQPNIALRPLWIPCTDACRATCDSTAACAPAHARGPVAWADLGTKEAGMLPGALASPRTGPMPGF